MFLHGTTNSAKGWHGNGGNMTTRKQATEKKPGQRKIGKLNKEALKRVEDEASDIVEALVTSTKKGHVMCTILLLKLADACRDAEDAETKKVFRSLALRLAKQPQLPPESLQEAEEEDAEGT